MDYCRKLTTAEQAAGRLPTGWSYRLPTEAEWEYACRAGTTTQYSFGESESWLGDYSWFAENSGGQTHPVGKKRANAWGLQDLNGNVWEWCADWYGWYEGATVTNPLGPSMGSGRVSRGGGWSDTIAYCRLADRSACIPSDRDDDLGFRLALSPSGGTQEAK